MSKPPDPFRWFDSSPKVIQLVVMMYVKYPLSLRNVENLLFERGIDICHETVRLWWNRFGPMFASEIRRGRVQHMRQFTHWRWHLDEVYVKINGEMRCLWRAVDHEGEVLESYVTKDRDKAAALKFIKKAMKRHGRPKAVVTDGLRSYGAAKKEIGNGDRQEVGRWLNNRAENSHQPLRRRERAMLRFLEDEDTSEIRLGPRIGSQSLQPGTPSHQPPTLQGETLGRAGPVASSHGIAPLGLGLTTPLRRRVAVGLTAPPLSS